MSEDEGLLNMNFMWRKNNPKPKCNSQSPATSFHDDNLIIQVAEDSGGQQNETEADEPLSFPAAAVTEAAVGELAACLSCVLEMDTICLSSLRLTTISL